MRVCALDPEMEYEDLANNLGGCFIDLMGGQFIINPLEPKTWDDTGSPEDMDAPRPSGSVPAFPSISAF